MKDEEFVYGFHAVLAVLETRPENVLEIWVDPGRRDDRMLGLIASVSGAGLKTQPANSKTLARKARSEQHQGVVARFRPPSAPGIGVLDPVVDGGRGPALVLALDRVTDPHNLGACLRVAEAAGAHAVLAPRKGAATLTPAVRAVAAGSAERIPFISVNSLGRALKALRSRGLWIAGLAGDSGDSLYREDLTRPCVLVTGSEGAGLGRSVREACDRSVAIPMHGEVESLNASVASGVALFEARRQRMEANLQAAIAAVPGLK